MAAETDAYWWRGVQWQEWLDYVGVVERPTEDAAMKRLALQTLRAVEKLEQVRMMIFRDVVKEVIREEWHKRPSRTHWTLRQIHAARGIELQWVEQTTKRGNTFIEVIEVEIKKSA